TPPHETVVVPARATIGELKREVGRHFGAVYWGLKSFVPDSIVGVRCRDSDLVHELMPSGSSIVVEGRMEEADGEEMYEGGNGGSKIVVCPCGGKEEDGERMICCDICEVWQHTRCVGIPDEDDVPPVFLCGRCENDMLALPTIWFCFPNETASLEAMNESKRSFDQLFPCVFGIRFGFLCSFFVLGVYFCHGRQANEKPQSSLLFYG
ncbi:hypothetical protein GW17_00056153, partial [Ensete ventricosum]